MLLQCTENYPQVFIHSFIVHETDSIKSRHCLYINCRLIGNCRADKRLI